MLSLRRRLTMATLLLLTGSMSVFVPRAAAQCGNTSSTCLAGRIDNFATADGAEPSSPSPELLAALNGGSTPVHNGFDYEGVDYIIGHTFTGCWPVSCAAGAILTFHVRGVGGSTDTDVITLGDGITPIYGVLFNTLQSIRTGGADVTWDPGDEATFTLDLGNLPTGLSGGPDIRSTLEDGEVSVVIDDDSNVDYIQLYVRVAATPAVTSTWGSLKATYR